mmetsp:Transcript_80368/g.215496  ORF Transcript_80368/g.215496 Transcript_80368/m.215496 type:complete len:197 (+) Transcript_80368:34-624(+)
MSAPLSKAMISVCKLLASRTREPEDIERCIQVTTTLLSTQQKSARRRSEKRKHGRAISAEDSVLMHRAYVLLFTREDPLDWREYDRSPIAEMLRYGNDESFRRMFRLSRNVFQTLLDEISSVIKDGDSPNTSKNVAADVKLGIALYYMAHGVSGVSILCWKTCVLFARRSPTEQSQKAWVAAVMWSTHWIDWIRCI